MTTQLGPDWFALAEAVDRVFAEPTDETPAPRPERQTVKVPVLSMRDVVYGKDGAA